MNKAQLQERLRELEAELEGVEYEEVDYDEVNAYLEDRVEELEELLDDEEEDRIEPDEDEEDQERLEPDNDEEEEEDEGEPEDYLRQYQYRKQTEPGSVASDPREGGKAARMKAHLLRQPRVRFMIPRAQGEDKSVKHSVTLNGYRLDLPKQTYLELPMQIVQVLSESLQLTEDALLRGQIDGDKSKEDALL